MSAKKSEKKGEFREDWKALYMFKCDDGVQPVCLVCDATVAVCKKYNLKRHYTKNYPELVAR